MKLKYPVDNEQIFLPNNIDITNMGDIENEDEDFDPIDPDDEYEDEEDVEGKSIDIKLTSIISDALLLSDYFRIHIGSDHIEDIANVFFDLVKRNAELREYPVALIDPGLEVNNFGAWYEYDAESETNEIYCQMIKHIQMYYNIDISDNRLALDIAELLRPYAIYYGNNDIYHIATFCVIYSIYRYIRRHKHRIIKTNKYLISNNPMEKNCIVAKRKVIY